MEDIRVIRDAEKEVVDAYINRVDENSRQINTKSRYSKLKHIVNVHNQSTHSNKVYFSQIMYRNNHGLELPQLVAIKMKKINPDDKSAAYYESYIMNSISIHKNIVRLLGTISNLWHAHVFLETEMCECSLSEFVVRGKNQLSKSQLRLVMIQLLRGLAHIHNNQFIHGDIKPDNILIARPSTGYTTLAEERMMDSYDWVKICDFGASHRHYVNGLAENYLLAPSFEVNSTGFKAPETLLLIPYDYGVDVWAAGCVMACVCDSSLNPFKYAHVYVDVSGKTIYNDLTHQDQFDIVERLTGPFDPQMYTQSREWGHLAETGVRPVPLHMPFAGQAFEMRTACNFKYVEEKYGQDAMALLVSLLEPNAERRNTSHTALMEVFFHR